jgi:hypothetical protein
MGKSMDGLYSKTEDKDNQTVQVTLPKDQIVNTKQEVSKVSLEGAGTIQPVASSSSTAAPDPSGVKKEDTFESLFPEPTVVIEGPPTWIWWLVLLIGSVLLGLAGFKLANSRLNSWLSVSSSPTAIVQSTPIPTTKTTSSTLSPTSKPATPTPSSSPLPTPTSSPTPTVSPSSISKSSISIRVLNGTTITGLAATGRSILEQAGFKVNSVGNANNQTYQTTVIYYQTGLQAQAQMVEAALAKYSVSLQESSIASPDQVLVVMGQK